MNLLLDSHAFLWWITDDPHLPPPVRQAIADGTGAAYLSVASIWELEIKRASGRLRVDTELVLEMDAAGLAPLAITRDHAVATARLPDHHRDPFDRMLVAQAISERLTLVTNDRQIRRYDIPVLWE